MKAYNQKMPRNVPVFNLVDESIRHTSEMRQTRPTCVISETNSSVCVLTKYSYNLLLWRLNALEIVGILDCMTCSYLDMLNLLPY